MNDSYPPSSPLPPAELPPVEPPSADFIVRLFLLPLVIVVGLVGGWLLLVYLPFGKLAGGERDVSDYLRAIQSDNEHRRWRAAYELASLIGNDEQLAFDGRLLGELTGLLNQALDRKGDDRVAQYLALTLGAFRTLEADPPGPRTDPITALAEAVGPEQATVVRIAAAESLARQAARLDDSLDRPDAVEALARAAGSEDPALRQRATFALGFFGGDSADAALRARLGDDDRFVRYNAAAALARRGDPSALPVLREMLSPAELEQVLPLESAAEVRGKVEAIALEALRGLQLGVGRGRTSLAETLKPEIQNLTGSELVSLRTEATALLKRLPGAS